MADDVKAINARSARNPAFEAESNIFHPFSGPSRDDAGSIEKMSIFGTARGPECKTTAAVFGVEASAAAVAALGDFHPHKRDDPTGRSRDRIAGSALRAQGQPRTVRAS